MEPGKEVTRWADEADPNLGHRQRQHCVKVQGKASTHVCVSCPEKARDWAHIHGESGNDPWADFVPLCRKCHIRYDGHGHNGRNAPGARDRSGPMLNRWKDPEYRRRMSDAHKGNSPDADHRAKLSAALKGKPWTAARRAAQR